MMPPKPFSAVLLCAMLLCVCTAVADPPDNPPAAPPNQLTTPPTSQPSIVGTPEIVVELGKGTGTRTVTLQNNIKAELKDISLTGVVTLGGKPASAKVLLATNSDPTNAAEVLSIPTLKAGGKQELLVTLAELWDPGDHELELRNNNTPITGSKIQIKNSPPKITLGGADPAKADLALVKDELATITLKNDGTIPYPLTWRLRVRGREVCGGDLTLERNGIALLDCRPSVALGWSTISDLFKNEATEDGHQLLLYMRPANGNFTSASPAKSFPVRASLNYFSSFWQQAASYVVIVVFLILGGLTSLFLSQALPNRIKRLNIQDQLDTLARTISDFSTNIDSKLQVMTRVERSRLRDLLTSRNTFSPDFSSIITECEARIAKLSARVALIQQMDLVYGRLTEALRRGVPPTKLYAIEACLERAKVLLTKGQPTEEESKATEQAIIEAATSVDALNQEDADFGQKLFQRATELKTSVATLAALPTFARINGKVPRPLQTLNRIPAAATTVHPAEYTSVDLAAEKLVLMREYVQLFEGATDEPKQRLEKWEAKLVEQLQTESWAALTAARLLVREMKDDIYPERLHEALSNKEVSIDMDPAFAYEGNALTFCVCFDSPAVNEAAAREELGCTWNFGDGLRESGWNVSHYFVLANCTDIASKNGNRNFLRRILPLQQKAEKKPFTVEATFRDADGKQIGSNAQPLIVSKKVEVTPSILGNIGERSRTEILKLSVALLIVVFGLVAGAREELLKLDILPGLVAVFLAGFSANSIKDLLTTKA